MNRRELILCAATLLFTNNAPASAATPSVFMARKRLDPNVRSIVFSNAYLAGSAASLEVRTSGNALWIESINWTAESGKSFNQPVNRNLPKNATLRLPPMASPRNIILAVTCLPLEKPLTVVDLYTA